MLSGWNEVDRRTKARWLMDPVVGYFRGDYDRPVELLFSAFVSWWSAIAVTCFVAVAGLKKSPDWLQEVVESAAYAFVTPLALASFPVMLAFWGSDPMFPMKSWAQRWLGRTGLPLFVFLYVVGVLSYSWFAYSTTVGWLISLVT